MSRAREAIAALAIVASLSACIVSEQRAVNEAIAAGFTNVEFAPDSDWVWCIKPTGRIGRFVWWSKPGGQTRIAATCCDWRMECEIAHFEMRGGGE